jgi:thioredoxin-related protein
MVLFNRSLVLFFLLLAFSTHAQVKWYSLEDALAAQKEKPRPIMLDAYTVWCGPCKLLDKNTFGNQYVSDYLNAHFYPVKFNAEGNANIEFQGQSFSNTSYDPKKASVRNATHPFTRFLGVSGYPTLVFFDENGNYLTPVAGYLNPTQIEIYLKLVHLKHYEQIKSQEDFTTYIKDFDHQFKG